MSSSCDTEEMYFAFSTVVYLFDSGLQFAERAASLALSDSNRIVAKVHQTDQFHRSPSYEQQELGKGQPFQVQAG